MMELVSRVKALLRRGGQEQPQDDEEYVLGELYVSKKRQSGKGKRRRSYSYHEGV